MSEDDAWAQVSALLIDHRKRLILIRFYFFP